MKKIISVCFIINCCLMFSQTTLKGTIISNNQINDTINFAASVLDDKYLEVKNLNTSIQNNKFTLKFKLDYPHFYATSLNSEKNSGQFRIEYLFLDKTTSQITFDSDYKILSCNGSSQNEYENKFKSYITNGKGKDLYFYSVDDEADNRLLHYIQDNPDSYVALWYLTLRFNSLGYIELYKDCLNSFSAKIKNGKLWKTVNEEINNVTIKPNTKFPELILKNVDLNPERLDLKNSKYTLIDFWFSRCRPCLEQVPPLRVIYEKYNSKGFNIIGISTDKTQYVPLWQKRVVEKGIIWTNLLDENAIIATREKIKSFPTNFLLNEKGEVIKKNISPEELEVLLKENLL